MKAKKNFGQESINISNLSNSPIALGNNINQKTSILNGEVKKTEIEQPIPKPGKMITRKIPWIGVTKKFRVV
ncbi:MAG: hypothetical protein ACM3SY_11960 [Candidatus Omnitrophota bacterium]